MKTALAFPATVADAIRFSEDNRKNGWRVIGAASVSGEGMDTFYDEWAWLPFVYSDDFLLAFSDLVRQRKVSKVFTSHEVIKRHLRGLMAEHFPDIELEVAEPHRADSNFIQLCARGYAAYQKLVSNLGVSDSISDVEHLAVLNRAFQMRGESGVLKLSHLMAALAAAPQGDVVEIGVLSGHSAFVLGWLARRYHIGSVLCIDPWTLDEAIQHDAPKLLQRASREIDFSDFFHEFRLNLLPSFHSGLNYIRETASSVKTRYGNGFQVGPTEFGTTCYCGRISLLHIDGNHDYVAVSKDVSLWWGLVQKGGWLIIDDYEWSFGDGPKRAADELLTQNPDAFQNVFISEGALFLQCR